MASFYTNFFKNLIEALHKATQHNLSEYEELFSDNYQNETFEYYNDEALSIKIDEPTSSKLNAPLNGNKTNGSNDVAAIGIASVTHHIPIQRVAAKTAFPSSDKLSGLKNSLTKKKTKGPNHSPISLFFNDIYY